jgi:hypothetical protein
LEGILFLIDFVRRRKLIACTYFLGVKIERITTLQHREREDKNMVNGIRKIKRKGKRGFYKIETNEATKKFICSN